MIYERLEIQLHAFLNLALDGGKWSASRPSRFTSKKELCGPRASSDAAEKIIFFHYQELNPNP
jgi:hypothetical protein